MDASLDTDIVIHLYKSNKQELIFSTFDNLYMYEFLVENELKKNSIEVYKKFMEDVSVGRVSIIANKDLADRGMKNIFDNYVREYEYLFDQGELRAIALAKALGITALITDDTKEYGPHYSLVKEVIADVVPFAFYELLFLKYINSEITINEFYGSFNKVNETSMRNRPMNFKRRIMQTVKRYSSKGTERDQNWIKEYCDKNNIIYKDKMLNIKEYLKNI